MSDAASLDAKLIPEPPLLVLPSRAAAIGLNEAILLQQIFYETRESELVWWPSDTAELRKRFWFWSESTVKRTLASLQRSKLVKVRQEGVDRTKRYRVQIDTVQRLKLPSNRPDARGQSDPIPISRKRVNGKGREAAAAKFLRFDEVTRR